LNFFADLYSNMSCMNYFPNLLFSEKYAVIKLLGVTFYDIYNFQKVPLDHYLTKPFDIFIYTAVLTCRIPVQMPIKKEKGMSEIINLYFKHYNCVIFIFGAKNTIFP
jgi:hypothetical protein